jgi:hypothetical protein
MTWLEKVKSKNLRVDEEVIISNDCPANHFDEAPRLNSEECNRHNGETEGCRNCWNEECREAGDQP